MTPRRQAAEGTPNFWTGSAAMRPGLGVFLGQSGDNREHRHGAHQLSIGLGRPVTVYCGPVRHCGPALFIRAHARHRLVEGPVLSLYLDPSTALAAAVLAQVDGDLDVSRISVSLRRRLLQCFPAGSEDLATGLQRAQQWTSSTVRPDKRKLLQILKAVATDASLPQLALMAGLSGSRFSHWFREQTGMPLRSYRKWLRLLRGVEHALSGLPLTAAAHDARFSDQAHFTRTFVQMFGVRPSGALSQLRKSSR